MPDYDDLHFAELPAFNEGISQSLTLTAPSPTAECARQPWGDSRENHDAGQGGPMELRPTCRASWVALVGRWPAGWAGGPSSWRSAQLAWRWRLVASSCTCSDRRRGPS